MFYHRKFRHCVEGQMIIVTICLRTTIFLGRHICKGDGSQNSMTKLCHALFKVENNIKYCLSEIMYTFLIYSNETLYLKT